MTEKPWPHRNRFTRDWVNNLQSRSPKDLMVNHDKVFTCANGAEVHVGNVPITQADFAYLEQKGFDAVLDMCCDNAIEHEECGKRGIIQHSEYVDDGRSPTQRQFDVITLFIEANLKAYHKVYIHCHAGAGRAPTVACAWLIRYRGMGVDEALEHLEKTRRYHIVSENQIEGLIEFANRHRRGRKNRGG